MPGRVPNKEATQNCDNIYVWYVKLFTCLMMPLQSPRCASKILRDHQVIAVAAVI